MKQTKSSTEKNEENNSLVIANCYDPNRNSFINLNFELIRNFLINSKFFN